MKPGTAGDEPLQERLRADEEREREQARRDLIAVLQRPEGRRVFRRLVRSLEGGQLWCQGAEIHARAARHDVAHEIALTLALNAPEEWRQARHEEIDDEERREASRPNQEHQS